MIVPVSTLAKYKTASQYVAITLLIVDKGVPPVADVPFHWLAYGALWGALLLTVVSGADYFYRFFRKADYHALVRDTERWS